MTVLMQCAGLWQGNHDGLAAFMAATGRAALPEAAALSGLSLQKEFELCKGTLRQIAQRQTNSTVPCKVCMCLHRT